MSYKRRALQAPKPFVSEPHLHLDSKPGLSHYLRAMAAREAAAATVPGTVQPAVHRARPRKRAKRRQVEASRKANRS